MESRPYPEDLDCCWIAADRDGHVGVFITAGRGPIPVDALRPPCLTIEEVGDLVDRLPAVSAARMLVKMKQPESFIAVARQGLYVYDWSDVHRSREKELRAYEPMAVPSRPITCADLPAALADTALRLRLDGVVFAAGENVDVRALRECVAGRLCE